MVVKANTTKGVKATKKSVKKTGSAKKEEVAVNNDNTAKVEKKEEPVVSNEVENPKTKKPAKEPKAKATTEPNSEAVADKPKQDSLSSKLKRSVALNSINKKIDEKIEVVKKDLAPSEETDKNGKPKERKEISKYRAHKVRFSNTCGKVMSKIITKAIGDLLNIAAEKCHANNKKTIRIRDLLENHAMLQSKYAPLFVSLPEFQLMPRREEKVVGEKVEKKKVKKNGKEEIKEKKVPKVSVEYVYDVKEHEKNIFKHYVENKFKNEIKEFKNKDGEVLNTMLSNEIKQYLNNLLVSFCEDFSRKLELYLSGNKLKTVSENVVITLFKILLTPAIVEREDTVTETGEGEELKVSVASLFKMSNGESFDTLTQYE